MPYLAIFDWVKATLFNLKLKVFGGERKGRGAGGVATEKLAFSQTFYLQAQFTGNSSLIISILIMGSNCSLS